MSYFWTQENHIAQDETPQNAECGVRSWSMLFAYKNFIITETFPYKSDPRFPPYIY